MYSQNNEEGIILDYFKEFNGTILDLGANDGRTLSNSLGAIERGWGAVCVEPSKTAFGKLELKHRSRPSVQCLNVAISDKSGTLEFYESGTHLKQGDTSLLSTLKVGELSRWAGSDNRFVKTTCKVITVKQLLKKSIYKTFDVISIDCEGVDWEILTQMDLKKLGCRMLIIETNGKETEKYVTYCAVHGMRLHNQNAENLIFVR